MPLSWKHQGNPSLNSLVSQLNASILTAFLHSFAILAKTRSSLASQIVSMFLALARQPPFEHLTLLQQKCMEKTIKNTLLSFIR
jgi:hypothetical protein